MTKEKLIVITNDDGIHSAGIGVQEMPYATSEELLLYLLLRKKVAWEGHFHYLSQ